MVGAKWTEEEETIELIEAYSTKTVQDSIEGMSSNKELYEEMRRIMKDESQVERMVSQIETKLKKLRSGYSKLIDRMKTSGAERPYLTSALTSVEKAALQNWDRLDRILGKKM